MELIAQLCNRISKRTHVMNPYAFPNLLHPSVPVDHRLTETNPYAVGPENLLSRAVFRTVCAVENLLAVR